MSLLVGGTVGGHPLFSLLVYGRIEHLDNGAPATGFCNTIDSIRDVAKCGRCTTMKCHLFTSCIGATPCGLSPSTSLF